MILKQNTFNLVAETMSSSEISSASLSNPFRESGTSRNWKSQNLSRELRAPREFVFKVIDNLSRVIDFYWSINNVWHLGGSAMVAGLLLKGGWFSSRRFFSSLPLPLPPPSILALARSYPGARASKIQDGAGLPNGTGFPWWNPQ